MFKKFFPLFIILLPVFTSSCEDYKDCNAPVETLLGINFKQVNNEEETDSLLPGLTFYAVSKPDSLLFHNTSERQIFVPLNPHAEETRFYIRPDSLLTRGDTLSIIYTTDLHFVSSGCGFTNLYKLDTVMATRHYIDSIALTNDKINTTNATNIKIYY